MHPLHRGITDANHAWDLALFETGQQPQVVRDVTLEVEGDTLVAITESERLPVVDYMTASHRDVPTSGGFEVEGLPASDPGGPGHAEQVVHLYPAGKTVCPICRGGSWFDPTRAGEATGIEQGPEAAPALVHGPEECPQRASHRA